MAHEERAQIANFQNLCHHHETGGIVPREPDKLHDVRVAKLRHHSTLGHERVEMVTCIDGGHVRFKHLASIALEPACAINQPIQSSNILLENTHSTAKISDFVVRRTLYEPWYGYTPLSVLYLAPEVLRGNPMTGEALAYSLGIVLDTHKTLYEDARERAWVETRLLARIDHGSVAVAFSDGRDKAG